MASRPVRWPSGPAMRRFSGFPSAFSSARPGIWPRWRKPLTRCSVTPRIWFGSLRHRRFAGPIRAGFYIGSILPHSNRKKDGHDKGVSVAYTGVESVFATLGGGIGMDGIWTERRRRLAEELLRRTDPVTVTRLASQLKVSPRTIRYDLDALQPWFQEQGLQLSKRPRRGVQVMGPEERVQSALRQLASRGGNPYRHPLRPEERVRLILAYLLQDAQNTRVRVQDLADRLGVSRGTLLSDLKTVEEKLAAYRIRLLRIPGYGLKLDADEFRWRQAAASLVFSELDPEHPDRSFRLAEAPKLSAPETVPSMASLLPRELMATIEAVLSGFDWEP